MNSRNRVVVTGLGIAAASGIGTESFWKGLLSGRSSIRSLTQLDTTALRTTVGGEIDTDAIEQALKEYGIRPDDRAVNLAMISAAQALSQAGCFTPGSNPEPSGAGVIYGTGVGSANTIFSSFSSFFEKGVKGVRPTTVPRCMANAVTAQLSMRFRLQGPNYVTICACASSTTAIGTAFRMIRDGYAENMLCGGTDSFFDPATFASWNNLGVMSRNADPALACRPFDSQRDGCVLGEGAASLYLESLDSAERRGAGILAEIAGYGESSDAEHITSPSMEGQSRAIRQALECAGITPADVSLINAHGTATKVNDETESATIRNVFGCEADRIPVVSNKSYFGHLLGASGAAETAASILMLRNRKIIPNLNLDRPDPACRINLPSGTAIDLEGDIIVKNSFGFGGNNAVLVLKRTAK